MESTMEKPIQTNEKMQIEHLLDLNDDCLLEILSRLPPTSLPTIGSICQKFHKLVGAVFKQNISKSMTFDLLSFGHTMFFSSTDSVKYYLSNNYAKYIRNIQLWCRNDETENAIKFLKTKGNVNYMHLEFNINGLFDASHCDMIGEKLNQLKIFKLKSTSNARLYDGFLRHCNNLENLLIGHRKESDLTWLEYNYSKLKTLEIRCDDEKQRKTYKLMAKSFIQRHPRLKILNIDSCRKRVRLSLTNREIDCLELEYLFDPELSTILDDIKLICGEKSFKRFKIQLNNQWNPPTISMLANLNNIYKIHGVCIRSYNGLHYSFTKLQTLKDLTHLKMEFYWKTPIPNQLYAILNLYSKEIPKLESFQLYLDTSEKEYDFKKLTMEFIENSPKMHELIFKFGNQIDTEIEMTVDDLNEFKMGRMSLKGACNTKIQLFWIKPWINRNLISLSDVMPTFVFNTHDK